MIAGMCAHRCEFYTVTLLHSSTEGLTTFHIMFYLCVCVYVSVCLCVSPHEFKGDTEMISEVEVVDHVNDVVLILSVLETDTNNDDVMSGMGMIPEHTAMEWE